MWVVNCIVGNVGIRFGEEFVACDISGSTVTMLIICFKTVKKKTFFSSSNWLSGENLEYKYLIYKTSKSVT